MESEQEITKLEELLRTLNPEELEIRYAQEIDRFTRNPYGKGIIGQLLGTKELLRSLRGKSGILPARPNPVGVYEMAGEIIQERLETLDTEELREKVERMNGYEPPPKIRAGLIRTLRTLIKPGKNAQKHYDPRIIGEMAEKILNEKTFSLIMSALQQDSYETTRV